MSASQAVKTFRSESKPISQQQPIRNGSRGRPSVGLQATPTTVGLKQNINSRHQARRFRKTMAIVTNNYSNPEPEFAISQNLSPISKRMKSSERFTQDETTSITRTMFSKELLSDVPRIKRSINKRNHSKRSFGSVTSSKKRRV